MVRVEKRIEVEYKYQAGDLTKEEFHDSIESIFGEASEPIYVVSCDDYYTNEILKGHSFLRYRKGGGLTELTLKVKMERKNSFVRKEINLNVGDNDDSEIVEFIKFSGYKKLFSVFKEAWIWRDEENSVDISYYTLPTGVSFIELEVECYNSEDGIEVLNQMEEVLGLQVLVKENRSLYEIFTGETLDIK